VMIYCAITNKQPRHKTGPSTHMRRIPSESSCHFSTLVVTFCRFVPIESHCATVRKQTRSARGVNEAELMKTRSRPQQHLPPSLSLVHSSLSHGAHQVDRGVIAAEVVHRDVEVDAQLAAQVLIHMHGRVVG